MKRPQVIFFDAVGTLFGVRGSVGTVYGKLAKEHGVSVDAKLLNSAFYESFKSSAPCAFPGAHPDAISELEYQWWNAIATQTFQQAGVYDQFKDFPAFFSDVYAHFATVEPWTIYPDVFPTLDRLTKLMIPLGILSNFDSRLYPVLKALNLSDYFSSITISTQIGVAKPDPKIFFAALDKYQCAPDMAWHIGDSVKEDYEAANSIGMRGVLLTRDEPMK